MTLVMEALFDENNFLHLPPKRGLVVGAYD
jgi:hypothetical protein